MDSTVLFKIARESIKTYLISGKKADFTEVIKVYPQLLQKQGSFVTVYVEGNLRGCVGKIEGDGPLYKDITDNAVDAAFFDTRFMPVRSEEIPKLHIEISLLEKPKKLDYSDENDLLTKLSAKKEGVLLQFMGRRSTFLPQVWEKIPNAKNFLKELAHKGGFAEDIWKEKDCQIFTYSTLVLKED